jgi:hypothetical protein
MGDVIDLRHAFRREQLTEKLRRLEQLLAELEVVENKMAELLGAPNGKDSETED